MEFVRWLTVAPVPTTTDGVQPGEAQARALHDGSFRRSGQDTALRSPNACLSCSTGATASTSRAAAASTESPAVSTTAEARA